MLASVPRTTARLPHIYVTGEFFANLAHNEGNYNLRRFIMDEGCEVFPGLFTNRVLYDFWRQQKLFWRTVRHDPSLKEKASAITNICVAAGRAAFVKLVYGAYRKALAPEQFGGRADLYDLDYLARTGFDYYHPEIFGGEGNLEVAEAIHYADKIDGFISCKPFGCLSSSGVSDGVQAKIMSLYPQLNFLSIETSGDNEVSILSRVSMLLFKAKQRVGAAAGRTKHPHVYSVTASPE
jgi:predicted nucleotide-binding protein (sugar kinase/HSP70/actin superfamily)